MKTAFVIDTDAGNFSDDFWALALQLCDPQINIRLIVTSGAETKLKTKVVAKFLTHCGRDDISIVRGIQSRESPYLLPDKDGLLQQQEEFIEGCVTNPVLRRWAQDYDLSSYNGTVFGVESGTELSQHGLKEVEALINETPNLTYVLQGSSTNVGYLLDGDDDLFRRNKVRIVCMGGTIEKIHEYNFSLDVINTRRMLAASCDVTVVPVEPSFHTLHGVGRVDQLEDLDPQHKSYSLYLNGDSQISLAMAQLQLALANYGTHKEVVSGTSDIIFDAVAAFVASGRRKDLYILEDMVATIDDGGRIIPSSEEGALSFSIMTKWVSSNAAEEFKYLVAKTVAAGTYTECDDR